VVDGVEVGDAIGIASDRFQGTEERLRWTSLALTSLRLPRIHTDPCILSFSVCFLSPLSNCYSL
jgi:hypothetical protein